MITIGKIEGLLMSARFREFDSKPQENKPSKHYKVYEYTFYAPALNITGTLKDWECTLDISTLKSGDTIIVHYNRCVPTKGMDAFFEFTGFCTKK